MKGKILNSMILLVFVTVLLSTSLFSIVMYRQISEDIHREMNNQVAYIAAGIAAEGTDYLSSINGADENSRITLINDEGIVVFDNRVALSSLDNHKNRPEVQDAIKTGRGEAIRKSDTLGSQTYYLALKLSDGSILRISSTTNSVFAVLTKSIPIMLMIVAVVSCLAIFIAKYQTKSIVEPINNLDLENPTENKIYGELSPLLIRIYHQQEYIKEQMIMLQQGKDKFEKITENMVEGLIILDEKGYILSANQSAINFFGTEQLYQTGKHFSNFNRSVLLQKLVVDVLKGQFIEEPFSLEQFHYLFRATPIIEDEKTKGAILLIIDITERQKSESIRREFTANVSHELKTPLTAISGFAELLKNDMVKSEDIKAFSGKIYEEATRLIALVEDIIRLSQLDEKNVPLPMEQVNLYEIAKKVHGRLLPIAEQKGVSLSLLGEEKYILGVPQLIDELITNLCDNAIKYNKDKGSVSIEVKEMKDRVFVAVSDTGIGIPLELQKRVFERFYRVDKSHSKATGGTGLGLSIVKHIASFHNGEIETDSSLGKGTKITVYFPRA